MVEDAEKEGLLAPGSTLIEPSSGNTGIGMALVCRIKGYKLKVVLPGNVSIERRQLLELWGADVIDSPADEGSNGAVRLAQQISAGHPEWTFLYQYANPANPRAHYETTGPEIWRDCPEITHFVAGLGTSGTLLGVGRFLKERNPQVQVWAVEPPTGEMVEGMRNLDEGYIPPIFVEQNGADLLDRKTIVGPKDSIEWTRRLTALGFTLAFPRGPPSLVLSSPRDKSTGGPSSSSPPTEGGSTCRPGLGQTISTSSLNGRGGSSTSDRPRHLLRRDTGLTSQLLGGVAGQPKPGLHRPDVSLTAPVFFGRRTATHARHSLRREPTGRWNALHRTASGPRAGRQGLRNEAAIAWDRCRCAWGKDGTFESVSDVASDDSAWPGQIQRKGLRCTVSSSTSSYGLVLLLCTSANLGSDVSAGRSGCTALVNHASCWAIESQISNTVTPPTSITA